jgi:hypothetical protein
MDTIRIIRIFIKLRFIAISPRFLDAVMPVERCRPTVIPDDFGNSQETAPLATTTVAGPIAAG